MPSISLCMIVKNEEEFIENCLNSVKDLVDEIIIVDTGSTDSTIDIAKGFGAKVFPFKWVDDFAAARNESLKHATKEWILVLDADEEIDKKDHERIISLVNNKSQDYDGFSFIQRNYTNKSDVVSLVSASEDIYEQSKDFVGWQPNPITRLFKNNKKIFYEAKVHETVDASIYSYGGKILKTSIPLHHFGRKKGEEFVKKKGELYLDIGKTKIQESPLDTKAHFDLGVQYQEIGDMEKAEQCFRKAIELKPDYAKAHQNLGANLLKKGLFDEAKKHLEKSLELELNPDAYNNLGIVHAKQGILVKAVELFNRAISLNPGFAAAYLNLGLTYDKMKQHSNAEKALKKAVELNPEYGKSIKFQ